MGHPIHGLVTFLARYTHLNSTPVTPVDSNFFFTSSLTIMAILKPIFEVNCDIVTKPAYDSQRFF